MDKLGENRVRRRFEADVALLRYCNVIILGNFREFGIISNNTVYPRIVPRCDEKFREIWRISESVQFGIASRDT